MKNSVLLCALLLAAASPGRAQTAGGPPPFMPDKNKTAALLVAQPFEAVQSLRGIDPDVLAAFRAREPEKIADRDEPYNATDLAEPGGPPLYRFVLAGKSAAMWFILFEQGGRRPVQHLVVLTCEGVGPWQGRPVATGIASEPTVDGLKAALKAGAFTE